MRLSRTVRALVAFVLLTPALATPPAAADHTQEPTSAAVVGSLQDELGCPGDWQPECADTELAFDAEDDVWQDAFDVPAGAWEYKVALNDTWDENYGAGAAADGPNIALSPGADSSVKFYYSHGSHWITDNLNSRIVTAPGSFQAALGCGGDWDPACLRSWLQDPDGDGTYTFSTTALPAGSYEAKAAIDESWDENYGAGGVAGGDNIPFEVAADGDAVTFTFVSATNTLTIATGGLDPGDELLVGIPARPAQDDVTYFVLPDRFANGDPSNDAGGDLSGDPLVNGFLPDDKGYYHGGDIAGLMGELDYLDGLGVTAIWMTPQFTNRWVQGDGTIDRLLGRLPRLLADRLHPDRPALRHER